LSRSEKGTSFKNFKFTELEFIYQSTPIPR